jgi:hypothetical protein
MLGASKFDLEVNAQKIKNMFKSFHQTPGQIHNTNVNNKFSEIVVRLKYFGMTVTNKNYID